MNILHMARHEKIDRRITGEMNALAALGHKVYFLSTPLNLNGAGIRPEIGCLMSGGGFTTGGEPTGKKSLNARVRALVLAMPAFLASFVYSMLIRWMDERMYRSFDKLLRREIPEFVPDVIHIHDLRLVEYALSLRARFPRVRLIYDAHEFTPFQNSNRKISQYILRREKHAVSRMDAVISVNPSIARRMSELYGIKEPSVIYNSAETFPDAPPCPDEEFLCHFGVSELPAGAIRVMFQGSFTENRNLENLVRAFELLPEKFHLFMLGEGPEKERLQKLACERVHFGAEVVQVRLGGFSRCASFGIVPYVAGGCENDRLCTPNKLFEFMAARLPVCASDLPELRNIIGHCGNGICASMESPDAISKALVSMEEKIKDGLFPRQVLDHAAEIFSYQEQMRKMESIYASFQISA